MADVPAPEYARRYLEDLLSFFGLNVRVEANVDDRTVELNVPTSALNGFLIGQHGQNLRSLQYLMNMVLRAQGYEETMVVVDVAGYKRQRHARLAEQAGHMAKEVLSTGQDKHLQPMGAAERRVVHQAIGDIDGVESASEGDGRDRHIVIKPTPQ